MVHTRENSTNICTMKQSVWRGSCGCWHILMLLTVSVGATTTTTTPSSTVTTVTATSTTTTATTPTVTKLTSTPTATTPTTTEASQPFESLASFDLSLFNLPDPAPVEKTCKKADMCASLPGICNKGTCSTRPCSSEIVCNCHHGTTGFYCDQNITEVIEANNIPMVNGKIQTTAAPPKKLHVNGKVEPYTIRQNVKGVTEENVDNGYGNDHRPPDNGHQDNGNNGHSDNGSGKLDNGGDINGGNGRDNGHAADTDVVMSRPTETSTSHTTHSESTTKSPAISTPPTLAEVTRPHTPSTTVEIATTTTKVDSTSSNRSAAVKSMESSTVKTTTASYKMTSTERHSTDTSPRTVAIKTSTEGTTLKPKTTTIKDSDTSTTETALYTISNTSPATITTTNHSVDGSYRKGPESFIFADNSPININTPVHTLRHDKNTQIILKHSTERIDLPRATVKMTYSAAVFPSNVHLGNTNTTRKEVDTIANDIHASDTGSKLKTLKQVKLKKPTGVVEVFDTKIILTNTSIESTRSGPDHTLNKTEVHIVNTTNHPTVLKHNSTKTTNERTSQEGGTTLPSVDNNVPSTMTETLSTTSTESTLSSKSTIATTDKQTHITDHGTTTKATINTSKIKQVTATIKQKRNNNTMTVPVGISQFADTLEKTVRETAALMQVSSTKNMSPSVFSPIIVNFLNIFQSPKFFSVVKSNTRVKQNDRESGDGKKAERVKTTNQRKHAVTKPVKATSPSPPTSPISTTFSPTSVSATTVPSSENRTTIYTSPISNDITTAATQITT